jgi:peptidoglycan/LPS O-acetylase OafA/YrhL
MLVSKENKVYFKNLNAVRFIAAAMVICHHIELVKSHFNLHNHYNKQFVIQSGRSGVLLFFTLSGFLITFLLLKEKQITNNIAIKKFYMRRILRIWPLYFFVLFLAFLVVPNIDILKYPGFSAAGLWANPPGMFILYLLILPNIATSIYGSFPFSSQTWSIGAEEQFYLVWPVFIKKIKNKWLLLLIVIVFYNVIRYIILYQFSENPQSNTMFIILGIWNSTPINCMAIGGLFSMLITQNSIFSNKIKSCFYNKIVQIMAFMVVLSMLITGFKTAHFNDEIYSLFFGIIICNLATNEKRLFSLEFKWLNYLGNISYGLYMYHNIFIVLSIAILLKVNYFNSYLLYVLVFTFTILIAFLSYEFFEKRFINKKAKYATASIG